MNVVLPEIEGTDAFLPPIDAGQSVERHRGVADIVASVSDPAKPRGLTLDLR
jgi:hypothetical protein